MLCSICGCGFHAINVISDVCRCLQQQLLRKWAKTTNERGKGVDRRADGGDEGSQPWIQQNQNYNERNDKIYVTLLMPMSLIRLIYCTRLAIILICIIASLLPFSPLSLRERSSCYLLLYVASYNLRCTMLILRWNSPIIIVVNFWAHLHSSANSEYIMWV